jgi:hypothetical protein
MQEGVGPKPAQQASAATYELKSEEVMATQRQTFSASTFTHYRGFRCDYFTEKLVGLLRRG